MRTRINGIYVPAVCSIELVSQYLRMKDIVGGVVRTHGLQERLACCDERNAHANHARLCECSTSVLTYPVFWKAHRGARVSHGRARWRRATHYSAAFGSCHTHAAKNFPRPRSPTFCSAPIFGACALCERSPDGDINSEKLAPRAIS